MIFRFKRFWDLKGIKEPDIDLNFSENINKQHMLTQKNCLVQDMCLKQVRLVHWQKKQHMVLLKNILMKERLLYIMRKLQD